MSDPAAMKRIVLRGARLFDGEDFWDDRAIIIESGRIASVIPAQSVEPGAEIQDLAGGTLAPGFIDVQVNGGGGVLFNEQPDLEGARTIARTHRRFGTTALLPTLITDGPDIMARAIEAARSAVAGDAAPGVIGLHLEGPFLAPSRKGAHEGSLIREMTDEDVEQLSALDLETLLLTIAPDQVAPHRIRSLVDAGITVSLGHSDASYEIVCAAVDAGARGVTHLFNAMSPLTHRAPGMVGAALDSGSLWCGIIADGHHVHPAALRTALRAKAGPGRLFLVTDAMPTAGCADDRFVLNGRTVLRHDGKVTLEDGTLAGSDLDMAQALRFTISELGVAPSEALRMASLYPAQFLGLEERVGTIRPGCRADLVLLDENWQVAETWIAGKPSERNAA